MKLSDKLSDKLSKKLSISYKTKNIHNLVISNHVSELDVCILLLLFPKYRFISDIKVKRMKFIYEIAKLLDTIFINRDIRGQMTLLNEVRETDRIILFPEGTLYYKPMIEQSDEYCKKNSILPFKHVICPKQRGFDIIRTKLKANSYNVVILKYVYDDESFLSNSCEPLTVSRFLRYPPNKIEITIDESNQNIIECFRHIDQLL